MRIAVEVLVPLWLFVYRFLSERRRSLLLALAVVAHLNLKFFKKNSDWRYTLFFQASRIFCPKAVKSSIGIIVHLNNIVSFRFM